MKCKTCDRKVVLPGQEYCSDCLDLLEESMDVVMEVAQFRMKHRLQWPLEHDDGYTEQQLAAAAACYAAGNIVSTCITAPFAAGGVGSEDCHGIFSERLWPWETTNRLYKHSRREQLLTAAALCIGEIQRLDRAES
jgi:hypothetical protein